MKKGDVVGFTNEEDTSPVAYRFNTAGKKIYQHPVKGGMPQVNNVFEFSPFHYPFEFAVSFQYEKGE